MTQSQEQTATTGSLAGWFAGRLPDAWGIPQIESDDFPYNGSAITLFDTGPVRGANPDGTDPPPTSDTPNRSGTDPHEAPRRAPWGQVQKSDFLSVGGMVTNPQPGGAPYFAWGWDGVTGL